MDEVLRALQRQYELGAINVVQWMRALQRANLPYHQLLIETWEKLLAFNSRHVIPPLRTHLFTGQATNADDHSQYLYAALELLEAFPIRCTCRQCSWVSHNGFCTCCLTGVCSPHRDGISGPNKVTMTTFGPACRSCASSCQTTLPDRLWEHPGKLALEVEISRPAALVRTVCNGYHYQALTLGEEERIPIDECQGTIREQIFFMMRHAACRIDADPPEERDDDLETWRDMLSELGPWELPPY